MTAPSGLLVVLLANQGYWFGGQEYTIGLQWVAPATAVDAVLEWQLMAGQVQLAHDRISMPVGERTSELKITPPKVRTRTTMQWTYRLIRLSDKRELETGRERLQVYPSDMLAGITKQVEAKRIAVVDRQATLTKVLSTGAIPHERLESMAQLQIVRADIVLVAPDELGSNLFDQSPILDQCSAGTCVGIFQQPRAVLLGGYATGARALPTTFEWRLEHPLLNGLQAADLESLFTGKHQAFMVRLPVDEPALEVAWWPREVAGREPVPIDTLLVTKHVGAGRLTLCQLPLGAWDTDPRHRQLLANMLAYLAIRPEPTPPPSRRSVPRPPATAPVPTITIPPGGVP